MLEKRRKNIRLARESYEISSQIFSLTICTKDRLPLFQNEKWAKLILNSLKTGTFGKHTELYAYCLMPDHIHILISPLETNLIEVINGWKSFTANLLRRNGLVGACWQRGFYDHAIRKEEDIRTVAGYILNNPVRANLVGSWINYPFSWYKWV